jgi:hypothetical protein
MKKYLAKIKSLQGVNGVFLLNNRADLLDTVGGEALDRRAKENLGAEVLQLLVAALYQDMPVYEAEFHFPKVRLIYFNFDKLNLFVIASDSANISMLRMTAKVVMVEALESREGRKLIAKNIIDARLFLRDDRVDAEEKSYLAAIKES